MTRIFYITEKFFINPKEWAFYLCHYCGFRGYLANHFKDDDTFDPQIPFMYVCTKCQSDGK